MVARSRTGLVALVLAAGVGLAGCAGSGEPRSNIALEVGDRTITVDELQGQVDTLRQSSEDQQMSENDGASVQQSLLSQAVMDELNAELTDRAGLEVDESEVEELKRQLRQQLREADQTLPESMIDESARRQVVQNQIPEALLGENYQQRMENNPDLDLNQMYQDEMQDIAGDLGIEVNPRYGAWDPETDFLAALQGQAPAVNPDGGNLAKLTEPEPDQQQPPISGQ